MTPDEMISGVRERLGYPIPQRPPLGLVLKQILSHTQWLMNRLSNTNRPWTSQETFLTVAPGVEDHQMPTGEEFGKALVVTTYDPGNSAHVERMIPIFEPQNLDLEWNYPRDAGFWLRQVDGSPHTAMRISFFRKSGGEQSGLFARLRPIPQEAARYRVMYTTGNWYDAAALGSNPVLSEHHHLIELRAARSLLPDCAWYDDDRRDAEKRKERLIIFNQDEQLYAPVFESYVSSMTQGRIIFRRGSRI